MKCLSDAFYKYPEKANEIMSTKDFRELMLETQGKMIAKGLVWQIIGKSLGAGLYFVCVKRP